MLDETLSPYVDPSLICLLAFLCDWLLGRTMGNFLPLAAPTDGMVTLIRWFERKLNRPTRPRSTVFSRGIIIVFLTLSTSVMLAIGLQDFLRSLSVGWGIEVMIMDEVEGITGVVDVTYHAAGTNPFY